MAGPTISRGEEDLQMFFDNDAPFDINIPFHRRQFEQFSCDIPSSADIIADPNDGRIPFMIDPAIVQGVGGGGGVFDCGDRAGDYRPGARGPACREAEPAGGCIAR